MTAIEDKPLVTVVIPTYRRPKLLSRAIQSVLQQTFKSLRVAVYDNASGDETSQVVGALSEDDQRISYHCHSENIGAIKNFNFGMAQVSTPYFVLLGDDNYLLPHFLEEAIDSLKNQSEETIFVGQIENIDEQGRFISRNLDDWPSGLVRAPHGLIHIVESGFPNWEGIVFRRQQIENGDVLDASFSGAADQEFIGRIARDYDFFVSKNVCAKFTQHTESWTSNRAMSEHMKNMTRLLERWLRDENWTANEKRRIRSAVNRRIEGAIRRHVIRSTIIGDNMETLETANEYAKTAKELSIKTFLVVKISKLVNTIPLLKRPAAIIAKLHLVKYRFRLTPR